jgi:ABC-type molybdate transport system substrate-binding protein
MEVQEKKRTLAQNRSEHKLFQETADECVGHGVTMKMLLENFEIYPTAHSIKDIWREIGRIKYGKDSTADLTTVENMEVFKEFRQLFINLSGGEIDLTFPSYLSSDEYLESIEHEIKNTNL